MQLHLPQFSGGSCQYAKCSVKHFSGNIDFMQLQSWSFLELTLQFFLLGGGVCQAPWGFWLSQYVTPDIPQSEIAATIFYDRAKSWAKNWAKFCTNFSGRIFVLHALCRTTHQNFSPNSSQFITPCLVMALVAEMSKFHLRKLLGLGTPKI